MVQNLSIDLIHLYPLENSTPHKTDKFELVHDEKAPIPILRRGLKFTMALKFKERSFKKDTDKLQLFFSFGTNANPIRGTKGIVVINPKPKKTNKHGWFGAILAETRDSLTLEVYAPSDIPVGLWKLQVETSVQKSNASPSIFDFENDIYFLFNPWCCEDLVYMPDERLLDEYVLTDVGKIWVGPYGSSRGREWVFGQFDAFVLPAITLMFQKSDTSPANRGDPIKVSRIISKMVNSNDDDGILTGRWDGEYEDGTAPSAWTGSVPILQQYLDTGESVSYGQCWVFSGVAATVCRALGIPARVVSNLVSAHDANSSLTIDKYYDKNDEELEYDPRNPMGEDSVWNYHVWNDVWMARPDLPKGYGGWQAIDATPQETSDQVYQCGPSSLEAIKRGAVGYNYDVAFMIASVNADLMRWKEDPECEMGYSRIFCNKYHIGRMILTKQPWIYDPNGDKDREDITHQYKAPEGTEAERLSLYNAVRATRSAKVFFQVPETVTEDVTFDLVDIERIKIGEPFSVTVNITNKSKSERNIRAVLTAGSCFYTGVKANMIKKSQGEFKMRPNTSEKLSMDVSPDEYLDKLVEYCIIKLSAITAVRETRQTWADEDDFQIIKPPIEIKLPKVLPMRKTAKATLQFTNPLKKVLTKCKFNVSGPGLTRNQIVCYPDVKPGALVKINVDVIPTNAGELKLVATFNSTELCDITGTFKVEVFDDGE